MRAGSLEALLPPIIDGRVPWRAEQVRVLNGPPLRDMKDGRGPAAWWATAHNIDPDAGSARFTLQALSGGEFATPGALSPYYSHDDLRTKPGWNPRTTKLGFRAGVVGNPAVIPAGVSDPLAAILGPGALAPGTAAGSLFVIVATGIEFDHAAVEALWPPHAGGRDPDHAWEDAARHVDNWVAKRGPLPKNKNGQPIIARAAALMAEWFDKNEPATPEPRSIYRWIRKNPHLHWW